MKTQQPKTEALTINQALGLCVVAEFRRLEEARAELQALADEGYDVPITPCELMKLEQNGYILDFVNGVAIREQGAT